MGSSPSLSAGQYWAFGPHVQHIVCFTRYLRFAPLSLVLGDIGAVEPRQVPGPLPDPPGSGALQSPESGLNGCSVTYHAIEDI